MDKKTNILSGGEKSRLALARMLVKPANLMLLDEPTNHLDVSSQEVLQEAMQQYSGTIIVVSHNRWFVNRFVNRVLEIRNGGASLFEGNIDDYLARRKRDEQADGLENEAVKSRTQAAASPGATGAETADRKAIRRVRAEARQRLSTRLRPWRKQVKEAEKIIEELEERKAELEQVMSDPELYADSQRWEETSREYAALERRLERSYQRWEEGQEQIESIEVAADAD